MQIIQQPVITTPLSGPDGASNITLAGWTGQIYASPLAGFDLNPDILSGNHSALVILVREENRRLTIFPTEDVRADLYALGKPGPNDRVMLVFHKSDGITRSQLLFVGQMIRKSAIYGAIDPIVIANTISESQASDAAEFYRLAAICLRAAGLNLPPNNATDLPA